MGAEYVIPCRFLALIAHLVITIMLYWSREPNILECVPVSVGVSSSEYNIKDTQLLIGLSVSVALLIVEFVGFMIGLSMFSNFTNIISVACHLSGSIVLSLFVVQTWSCDTFWYMFGFCSIIPFLMEILVIIHTLRFKVFL